MAYYYTLITHYKKSHLSFPTAQEDKEYAHSDIPSSDRPSLDAAMFFRQLEVSLSTRLIPTDLQSYAQSTTAALDLCKKKSFPFQAAANSNSYPDSYLTTSNQALRQYSTKFFADEEKGKSTEFYLRRNFQKAQNEKLLHVRECEHPFCTLNANKSDFIKSVNHDVRKQVVEYIIEEHLDTNKTINYGGFAVGFLKRDLDIIEDLIKNGYKKFKIFLLDTDFEELIKLCLTPPTSLDLEKEIQVGLQHKAITEFSSWLAAHINTSESNPIEIHLFANINDAEDYFKSGKEKLTVLVGQDYWTRQGYESDLPTPNAHVDFMRLAQVGLATEGKGRFFELIKQDRKREIYFHVGEFANGKYCPLVIHQISTSPMKDKKDTIQQHTKTKLSLFSGDCKEDEEYLENRTSSRCAIL